MNLSRYTCAIVPIVLLLITSCSGGGTSLITPDESENGLDAPLMLTDKTSTGHQLSGVFTATFDIETHEASVKPDRTLNAHYDVTSMIPNPLVTINSWDSIEEVADVDIQIHNPTWISVYDVRLIIYTDDAGHELINEDNWTPLWDIPGGQIANPFKAFAKYEPNRIFNGQNEYQENFRIKCPGSNFSVQFAVDVSYPGNCAEPYRVRNFQYGVLYEDIGSSVSATVEVSDWQNDVSQVLLLCSEITNEPETPFEHVASNTWRLNLINNTGAAAGVYDAIIYAKSTGSANLKLIDSVTIAINESNSGIPFNPQVAGFLSFPYFCKYVSTQGDYAYIDDKYAGVKIVDVSDIYNPQVAGIATIDNVHLGSYPTSYFPYNDFIFCREEWYGLQIVDVSNLKEPVIINEISSISSGDIKFRGDYAFFHDNSRITAYDVSDVYSLENVGSISYDSSSGDWVINGNYIFLPHGTISDPSLLIIDASDPANMQQASLLQTESVFYDIAVAGDYAYITNAFNPDGIIVLNVSDPYNPYSVNEIDLGREYDRFEVAGNYLYCIERNTWLFVLDITDPQNPVQISELSIPGYEGFSYSGNAACIWGDDAFATLDVSDPYNPVIACVLHVGDITDFEIRGDNLYMSLGPTYQNSTEPGLKIFDITNPEEPEYLSGYLSNGKALDVNGDMVYLMHGATAAETLDIIDVSDVTSPYTLGTLDGFQGDNSAFMFEGDCVFSSGHVYYTTGHAFAAFQRANVSVPTNPYFTFETESFVAMDIEIWGANAYAIGSREVLYLLDISDPFEMEFTPILTDFKFSTIHISDSKLYCCAADSGYNYKFQIYDISTPSTPVMLGEINYWIAGSVTVSGNYAYIQDYGLTCFDISDPANIEVVGNVDLDFLHHGVSGSRNIKVSNNYAYLRKGYYGITIIKLWD